MPERLVEIEAIFSRGLSGLTRSDIKWLIGHIKDLYLGMEKLEEANSNLLMEMSQLKGETEATIESKE